MTPEKLAGVLVIKLALFIQNTSSNFILGKTKQIGLNNHVAQDNLSRPSFQRVQPPYLVDGGPCDLVEQTSKRLSCIYEKNEHRSRPKNGRLQTILPESGVSVKGANRAGKYCQSWL